MCHWQMFKAIPRRHNILGMKVHLDDGNYVYFSTRQLQKMYNYRGTGIANLILKTTATSEIDTGAKVALCVSS